MFRPRFAALLCAALSALVAMHCGAPTAESTDGGTGGGSASTGGGTGGASGGGAGGATGGGSVDDGGADAAVPGDAGAADAGAADGGTDAGPGDAGASDAGSDAGPGDAGHPGGDAGLPDSGTSAGFSDAGLRVSGADAGLRPGELALTVGAPGAGTFYTGVIDLVVQGDRIVTLSNPRYGSNNLATLTRFFTDGGLDLSFGTNGFTVLDPGGGQTFNGVGLGVDGSGRLLVGAQLVGFASATSFAAARTSANGVLDMAYGTNGFARHSFGSASASPEAMTVDATGAVLVGGSYGVAGSPGPDQWAVVRFSSTGTLDATLGTAGELLIEIRAPGANGVGQIYDLQALDGGAFVASGMFSNVDADGGTFKALLARFNADGTFDAAFGTAGRVDLPLLEGSGLVRSLAVQSTGRLVVWETQLDLLAFTASGAPDSTWGSGGTATLGRVPATIASGPGDFVYAAGQGALTATGRPAQLVRRQASGAADTSFGARLIGLDAVGTTGDVAVNTIGFLPDGRVIVGGLATPAGGGPGLFLALFAP